MSTAARILNNAGHNAPPGALDAAPVLSQTAQTATDSTTGGDHELTLAAGKAYLVMTTGTGGFIFGLAATTTAGNIRWMCPANWAVVIRMPIGYTTLHYQGLVNGSTFYIVELVQ